jgi:hypothetical protein
MASFPILGIYFLYTFCNSAPDTPAAFFNTDAILRTLLLQTSSIGRYTSHIAM